MKRDRHGKIIELIGRYDIETQEELAEKLNEAGFQVTQATVSRDIRELKLTKMTMGDRQRYVAVREHSRQSFNRSGFGVVLVKCDKIPGIR